MLSYFQKLVTRDRSDSVTPVRISRRSWSGHKLVLTFTAARPGATTMRAEQVYVHPEATVSPPYSKDHTNVQTRRIPLGGPIFH